MRTSTLARQRNILRFQLRYIFIVNVGQELRPSDVQEINAVHQFNLGRHDGTVPTEVLGRPLSSPYRRILEKVNSISKPIVLVRTDQESMFKNVLESESARSVEPMNSEYLSHMTHELV